MRASAEEPRCFAGESAGHAFFTMRLLSASVRWVETVFRGCEGAISPASIPKESSP
jgi:hypothetical protein